MKLYSFFTPSHQILKEKWYVPSLHDDVELVLECYEQECPSGRIVSTGWREVMMRKVDLILRAIEENWGGAFIHSDVDVQFFGKIEPTITKYLVENDIVVQRDTPLGDLCAGFFACRGNHATLQLWRSIKHWLTHLHSIDRFGIDQCALNILVRRGICPVRWGYLPLEFYGGGTLTGRIWSPGMPLEVPQGILMHHANYTRGIDHKIAQLEYVQSKVQKNECTEQQAQFQSFKERFAEDLSQL